MTDKTIRMPKKLLAKWLEALRTSSLNGKPIKQARGVLRKGNSFCCLGVLQMCAAGRTQKDVGNDVQLPSPGWLEKNGVTFLDEDGSKDEAPYLPKLSYSASAANDRGRTFAEIADAIEACAEGY